MRRYVSRLLLCKIQVIVGCEHSMLVNCCRAGRPCQNDVLPITITCQDTLDTPLFSRHSRSKFHQDTYNIKQSSPKIKHNSAIMRIRIRGPSGMSQVNMEETATWGELKHEISTKTSVADFDVKYGYPPQNLDTTSIDNDTKLADVGIKLDGEQLIILPRDVQQSLHNPMGSHVDPSNHGTLPSLKNIQPPQHKPGDFPSGQSKGEQAAPLSLQRKPNDVESDPPEVPVPNLEGVLVLRVMPDDNSCMFRALGSAVLGDALDAMNEVGSSNCLRLRSLLTKKSVALFGGPDDPVKSRSVYCWHARKSTRRLLPLDSARRLLGWWYRTRHPLSTIRH